MIVTGNIRTILANLQNVTLSPNFLSGTVQFTLVNIGANNIPTAGPNNFPIPLITLAPVNLDGSFVTSLPGNDVITPVNTLYQVGIFVPGVADTLLFYQLSGSSLNLNFATPLSTSQVQALAPIAPPSGFSQVAANLFFAGASVGSGLTTPAFRPITSVDLPSPLGVNTIQITEQAVGPIPALGTVNLYTKLIDKGLYYKKDDGTEIGPLSGSTSILSLNNLFTGTNSFGNNTAFTGPNPYFDVNSYGGYVANFFSIQTATCSINASSTSLSCNSNPDFQNGQGIVVNFAGALPTLPAVPPVGNVIPVGVINGSNTYAYQIVHEDYKGGLTAAGSSGSTSVGAAALGLNTVSLTSGVRASGVDTFTCAANCNVGVGSQVQISGFNGNPANNFNGTVVVNSTPSPTTFTVLAQGLTNQTATGTGTLSVNACNQVYPGGAALAQESKILRSWIYRQNGGAGSFSLVGVAPGQDPFYADCGLGISSVPTYVPLTAPGAAQAGYLATTIVSGGGTNTMTLANAAGTTASSVFTQHDNCPPLKSAIAAAYATNGGEVSLPVSPGVRGLIYYPFNSVCDLTTVSNPQGASLKIRLAFVGLSQPWILSNGLFIEGIAQVKSSFNPTAIGEVFGGSAPGLAAFPVFLANHNTQGGITISNLKITSSTGNQVPVVLDADINGGGRVSFNFNDVSFIGNDAPGLLAKGGFNFWFNRGTCAVLGTTSGTFRQPPCLQFTAASSFIGALGQVAGDVIVDKTQFSGGVGVQLDNIPRATTNPQTNSSAIGNLVVRDIFHENNAGPTARVYIPDGSFGSGIFIENIQFADQVNGTHQPILEMTGTTNFNNAAYLTRTFGFGNPTLLSSSSGSTCVGQNALGCGPSPNRILVGGIDVVDGGSVGAINNGTLGYQMLLPGAPLSCVVGAGGSVPTGNVLYAIAAVDRSGFTYNPYAGVTQIGPTCSVTTTGGNQSVTISRPTLPVGAVGWLVYRSTNGGAGYANILFGGCAPGTAIAASTASVVDSNASNCGASAPASNTAYIASINNGGLAAGQLTLSGEVLTASPREPLSSFLPGALTSTWTGLSWTLDKAITVTRVQVQVKTAPVTCSPNAAVRLSDGTTNQDVTVSAAANDSGAVTKNYAAGATLTVAVQTAAAGCGTSPADANVVVQYRMQ